MARGVVAMNMAAEMSKVGTKVLFISLEESYRDLSLKVICSQSGVPAKSCLIKMSSHQSSSRELTR